MNRLINVFFIIVFFCRSYPLFFSAIQLRVAVGNMAIYLSNRDTERILFRPIKVRTCTLLQTGAGSLLKNKIECLPSPLPTPHKRHRLQCWRRTPSSLPWSPPRIRPKNAPLLRCRQWTRWPLRRPLTLLRTRVSQPESYLLPKC